MYVNLKFRKIKWRRLMFYIHGAIAYMTLKMVCVIVKNSNMENSCKEYFLNIKLNVLNKVVSK